MAPAAPPAAQAQFHRFRLSDFHRVESPSAAPVGQCSRFRISDFVPYDSATSLVAADAQSQSAGHLQANGGAVGESKPGASNTASPRLDQPVQPLPPDSGAGGVSAMPMNASPTAGIQTSTSGGMGGVLKANAPQASMAPLSRFQNLQPSLKPEQQQQSQQQNLNLSQQHPILQQPVPIPIAKFDPSQYPENVRWELARVLNNIQTNPSEFTALVVNALITVPSVEENSLLRHIGALYPQLPMPAPIVAQSDEDIPQAGKRKRGRPSSKKPVELDCGTAGLATLRAIPPVNNSFGTAMGPPLITVIPARKDKDAVQTCTRCLKPFNPGSRPTPASDPSSEATCAVRHPYPDFASGLVVSLPARKRNNYKTTWRWRCCGREVQSTSDEMLEMPRKEDDKTGGWCFVGKHTTEPGVREKFGMKPGKGKLIDEIAGISERPPTPDKKRAKLTNGVATLNGGPGTAVAQQPVVAEAKDEPNSAQPAQSTQKSQPVQKAWSPHVSYAQTRASKTPQTQTQQDTPQAPQTPVLAHPQAQQQSQPSPSPQSEQPSVKRKRGRPKGSKSKNKQLGPGASPNSPDAQMQSESAQPHPKGDDSHIQGETGSTNYWSVSDVAVGKGREEEVGGQHVDGIGMSPVELGLLVSATAAMDEPASGSKDGVGAPGNGAGADQTPIKRGRGRPKGVKNGAGKAAIEKKRQEEEQREQVQHQDHSHELDADADADAEGESQHPEPIVSNTITAGAGGGWFPGDDQWSTSF